MTIDALLFFSLQLDSGFRVCIGDREVGGFVGDDELAERVFLKNLLKYFRVAANAYQLADSR